MILAEGLFEDHHDDETDDNADGGDSGVTARMRFGDYFLAGDEEHGASGEGQAVWREKLCQRNCGDSEETADGFDDAGE